MKITLDQVKENSKRKVTAGPDAGKTILERNLERMKNWRNSRIEAMFDENNHLIHVKSVAKELVDDRKIIGSSYKLIRQSLQATIKEAGLKDAQLPKANGSTLARLASEFLSKENIMKKFKDAKVEYPN